MMKVIIRLSLPPEILLALVLGLAALLING
jgi:hypothetical protein